jgi:hypothetical protein
MRASAVEKRQSTLLPGELRWPHEVQTGLVCDCQEVFGVPTLEGSHLAACFELLQRVLADRLSHREARLTSGALQRAQEALLDERAHDIEQRGSGPRAVRQRSSADRLRVAERESANEDREATEHPLLRLG